MLDREQLNSERNTEDVTDRDTREDVTDTDTDTELREKLIEKRYKVSGMILAGTEPATSHSIFKS